MQGEWIKRPTNGTAVVFVHGILSSGEACWRHENGIYWPELLNNEEFNALGIYVFTYQTGIFSGNYRLGDVVDSLKEHMRLDGLFDAQQIIFVCHSMGGIVVRQFLVDRQTELIDRKIEIHLFLVGSPSLGSSFSNWLAPISWILRNSQALALRFSPSNAWLNDLAKNFRNLKEEGKLHIEGKELIEDRSSWPLFFRIFLRKQIVEPFSAAVYFKDPVKVPGSDHFSIAKPDRKGCIQHRLLCQFIRDIFATAPIRGRGQRVADEVQANLNKNDKAAAENGKSGACESDAVVFASVRSYVDTGDYISAVQCLLGDETFSASDPQTRIDVVSIYQKFGLLKEAAEHLDPLRHNSDWPQWEPQYRACIDVVALKVLSQQHDHEAVLSQYEELCSSLRRVERADLIPGILRRAAVAHAVRGGGCETAMDVLARACGVPEVKNDLHDRTTNDVYLAMTTALACPSGQNEPHVSALVEAQYAYLGAPLVRTRFQAMPFKSTIQSLYAEAAVLLTQNRTRPAGMLRIAVAHVLGPRAHTNPNAEGYAELLALIKPEDRRAMLQLAMRSDDAGRHKFQTECRRYSPYLRVVEMCRISCSRWGSSGGARFALFLQIWTAGLATEHKTLVSPYSSVVSRLVSTEVRTEELPTPLPATTVKRRAQRHRDVVQALDTVGLSSALRGSWLYGDFHLSSCGRYSLSDLDLVVQGATPHECENIAYKVHARLLSVIDVRVSVHPADHLDVMELADARFLVIGECLANLVHRVSASKVTADYVRAKGSLMVLRDSTLERYVAVARRIGTPDALLALFVKLGAADSFPVDVCRKLLHVRDNSTAVELAQKCLCGALDLQYVADTIRRLGSARSVDPWLKKNLVRKITGGSSG